ncbi:MAG: NCS2 family permease [Bacteroidaceae bacterium]|nr:NCS2 family permease [Bacteroidaceae bacterium]
MSFLKVLGFDPAKHNVKTEIVAGITTFLTMAYILAVNPDIFGNLEAMGMPKGAVFTATALAAIVGTLVMSLYAKKPYALAPGLGLNAFFVYTVCLTMGYSWQFALTAVLIEGIIFIILTVTNVREAIINAIPKSMKSAVSAGIGLFIAFIGMVNANIIVDDGGTIISLGTITSGPALLAIVGLVITSVMMILKVPGAMLIGIIVTAVIGIPFGITKFDGVVSSVPSVAPIFWKFEFHNILSWDMLIVVFTFLFIDMFDTIGTVIGVSKKANTMNPDGTIPGVKKVLMADAVATVWGAICGTSTTTTYVESASGVAEGGRTGLTSFTTAVCFAIALFFAPLFIGIPSAATAPALIIVGVMMMSSILDVDFNDFSESIPAYICMIVMPLAYSISDGIMLGMISFVVLNALTGKFKKISVMMWILAILFVLRYIFL